MMVELKPSEYAMAVQLAANREFVNKDFGVSDKQMGQDDGFKISVDGIVAEFAVCKFLNVWTDLSFDPRGGGHDLIRKGEKVDVKSTKFGRTTVFLPQRKKYNDIDRYVWCYVNFRTVEILGSFKPEEIFIDANLKQSPRADEMHYKIDLTKITKLRRDRDGGV